MIATYIDSVILRNFFIALKILCSTLHWGFIGVIEESDIRGQFMEFIGVRKEVSFMLSIKCNFSFTIYYTYCCILV